MGEGHPKNVMCNLPALFRVVWGSYPEVGGRRQWVEGRQPNAC